jgi:methylamine dehydrogenase accessory protein MauD
MAQRSTGAVLLCATAVFFAGLFVTRDADLNQPAPNFSLPEAFGGSVGFESYRGRPVLLVFWATSCGICRRELPAVSRVAPEFRSKGIGVVAIHVGWADDVRDFMQSNHIALTSLVDAEGAVGQAYHVSGVPKMVLIGADGKIKRTKAGMADESELREWVEAAGAS